MAQFAQHQASKLIASGKMTFGERVAVHRVARLFSKRVDLRREQPSQQFDFVYISRTDGHALVVLVSVKVNLKFEIGRLGHIVKVGEM